MAPLAIVATTKNRQRLGYRRIVTLLVYLIIVPTVLLLGVGIVLLFADAVFNIIFGVLTVAFVLVLVTGIVLILFFLRREANLSELQADFVSKVSHEFRTPLTSIRLFVETMERSKGKADVQEQCLHALGTETARLTRLIERLLDWGRMEAGRYKFAMTEQSVEQIVAEFYTEVFVIPLRDCKMHRKPVAFHIESNGFASRHEGKIDNVQNGITVNMCQNIANLHAYQVRCAAAIQCQYRCAF